MSDVHVLPVNDLIEHSESRDCVCRPVLTDVVGDDAVVVHHAADGREHFEPDGPYGSEVVQ